MPVLLTMGLDPELANGTNRIGVLAAALASLVPYLRARIIPWKQITPLIVVCVAGTVLGAILSEIVPGSRLHLVVVGALLVALAILLGRPTRWLFNQITQPRVGWMQLMLIFLVGIWMGFIFLDCGTYLLFILVLSARFDLIKANAIKTILVAVSAATAIPVMLIGNHIDWSIASWLSVGAMAGGLIAARAALIRGADRWIYALIVLMVGGELVQLVLADLWH